MSEIDIDPESEEYLELKKKLKHWSGPFGLVNCTSDEDIDESIEGENNKNNKTL
jgi:hypothetical protein